MVDCTCGLVPLPGLISAHAASCALLQRLPDPSPGDPLAEPAEGRTEPQGPDDGHTFRITAESRGSYIVVGDEHHKDADRFVKHGTVEVRAWNLPDALRKASELTLALWYEGEEP